MFFLIDVNNNVINFLKLNNYPYISNFTAQGTSNKYIECFKIAKSNAYNKICIIEYGGDFTYQTLKKFQIIYEYLVNYELWNIFICSCDGIANYEASDICDIYKINDIEILLMRKLNAKNIHVSFYNNVNNIFDKFIEKNNFNAGTTAFNHLYKPKIHIMKDFANPNIVISEQIHNQYSKTDLYVINLKESRDRMKNIYEKFSNFNIFRIDAIGCYEGWKGCFLSHLECIKYAKKQNLKNIFVIEDDCSPCNNFVNRFANIKKYLDGNDDWYLYLGGCNKINENNILNKFTHGGENFITIKNAHCMHFVCYNYKIYDFFLNHIVDKPIDVIWSEFTNAIVSVPFIAYQNSLYSYIERKNKKQYRAIKYTDNLCIDYVKKLDDDN